MVSDQWPLVSKVRIATQHPILLATEHWPLTTSMQSIRSWDEIYTMVETYDKRFEHSHQL